LTEKHQRAAAPAFSKGADFSARAFIARAWMPLVLASTGQPHLLGVHPLFI
jgi:hypothetical protein